MDDNLTHREITYRLYYRLLWYSITIEYLGEISRTKLRGVLAFLKTVGCFVCSKESSNVLTKISLRDDLKSGYTRFREMHDLGLLGLASYNKISLSVGDLSELITESTRNFIGNPIL